MLIVGGGATATSELYDPATNSFGSVATLVAPRSGHTASLLQDGTVLVAGGYAASPADTATTLTEIYDPTTNAWTAATPMGSPRYSHTASTLSNGKVLVAGGGTDGIVYATAEVYDPSTATWAPTGAMTDHHESGAGTPLGNGYGLVAGGIVSGNTYSETIETYNPTTNAWTGVGGLGGGLYGIAYLAASTLADGRALITGGLPPQDENPVQDAIIYDPVAGETYTANMITPRRNHTQTTLLNGSVLVAGGYEYGGEIPVAQAGELFGPCTPSACASGICSDGVCCNVACNGSCQACTVLAGGTSNGTCTQLSTPTCTCEPMTTCPPGDDCGSDWRRLRGMINCGTCGSGQMCMGNTGVAGSSSSSSSSSTSTSSGSTSTSSGSTSSGSTSSGGTSSGSTSSGGTSSGSTSSGSTSSGGTGGSGSNTSSGGTGGSGSSTSSGGTGGLAGTGGSSATGGSATGGSGTGNHGTVGKGGGCGCKVAGDPEPATPRGLAAFGVLALAGMIRARRRRA